MEALEVSPEETLYVGDSHQDIDCAHRAGVRSAAALWGSVNREQVLARRPHYQLETVGEFAATLGLG
jgi:phosphoglycolate phosphatase